VHTAFCCKQTLGEEMKKKKKKAAATKYSLIHELYEGLFEIIQINKKGEVKIKKSELKQLLEESLMNGVKAAAGGERVRLPVLGALVRKEVKARKTHKGVNPFTKEMTTYKARPASKKPRWSFPKPVKELFANKRYW
jgi:nucleoid DNA-binding protein